MNLFPYGRNASKIAAGAVLAALCAAAAVASGQEPRPNSISPNDLMRSVANNEIAAAKNSSAKFMFHSRRQNQKGVQNKVYIESNETMVGFLVGESDQPLNPQQERTEIDQLTQLAYHPDRLRRRQDHEKQELDHTLRILRAMPDAFCFEYAPEDQNPPSKNSGPVVRLNFHPNPSYSPPSTVEQVLTGMQGYVLVDTKANRFVRVEGTLFKDVSFGWGIFGKLDKGGKFRVEQADIGDGNWRITEMSLRLTGKILMLKRINLDSDEAFSDFRRLPDDLPFAKAVELLQAEHPKLAQNAHTLRASGQ